MAELYFDDEADKALTRLDADPSRKRLAEAVNRVVDQLEADPGVREVRRHRFTNGLWCVVVAGNDEGAVVLWEPHPDDPDGVIVQYIGPASFT